MDSKNFLSIALFLSLAWVTIHGDLNKNDKRYLECHSPYEVCDTTRCCDMGNEKFTCQPYIPVRGTMKLYPMEKRCMPPNSNMPMKFPYTCHQPLEICKNIGCCNDADGEEYVCAPYKPQYPNPKKELYPCEYRCEYKKNVTMPCETPDMCIAKLSA